MSHLEREARLSRISSRTDTEIFDDGKGEKRCVRASGVVQGCVGQGGAGLGSGWGWDGQAGA